jgi:hypothetical protein
MKFHDSRTCRMKNCLKCQRGLDKGCFWTDDPKANSPPARQAIQGKRPKRKKS